MNERRVRIALDEGAAVSGLWCVPEDATWLYLFAHGAGAGMEHGFMEGFARRLGVAGIATLRYQFPYTERGGWPPDRRPVLLSTVRSVAEYARAEWPGRICAGGKSMGGRMTSMAQAEASLSGVEGLCFVGFPLHPAKRPGTSRAEHLTRIGLPLLFLQGARDALADLTLLEPIVAALAAPARLHVLEGADHGLNTRKKDGRSADEVHAEAVTVFGAWLDAL